MDAIREVYREPKLQVTWGRTLRKSRSFLPAAFELAVGTGRPIGAILVPSIGETYIFPGTRDTESPEVYGNRGREVEQELEQRFG